MNPWIFIIIPVSMCLSYVLGVRRGVRDGLTIARNIGREIYVSDLERMEKEHQYSKRFTVDPSLN